MYLDFQNSEYCVKRSDRHPFVTAIVSPYSLPLRGRHAYHGPPLFYSLEMAELMSPPLPLGIKIDVAGHLILGHLGSWPLILGY